MKRKKLLGMLGYEESQSGKTSGSRVAFYDEETGHIIRLHKPHPTKVLTKYQLQQIIGVKSQNDCSYS